MNRTKAGVMAVAGCAAVCAGLAIVPGLLGGAAVGGAVAALEGKATLAVPLALIAAAAYLWSSRSQKADCGSLENAGCKCGGNSCQPPDPTEPA